MTDELRLRKLKDKYMTMLGAAQLMLMGEGQLFFKYFMTMAASDTGADRIALLERAGRNWRVVYAFGNHAPELGEEISLDGKVTMSPLDSWWSRPTADIGWDAIFPINSGLPNRTVLAVDDTDAERDFTAFKNVFQSIADTLGTLIRVRKLMTKDIVTGLPNQLACEARLDEELLRVIHHEPHQAVIALVALDKYGEYEVDSSGKAMRYLGHLLRSQLPETAFVGRIGEDRFLVIQIELLTDASGRLDAIRKKLAATQEIIATCSVGIALMTPELVIDPSLGRAQAALERAFKTHDKVEVDPLSQPTRSE
ncbi:GGDEF domain-containing protein [Patescibacteria group bacterium]|nr:GGDEF domain-containing protein [Patescibacteria group bacterium]MBU1673770.1 GGDEF domain-containing protein [Patescibacteria group bacterium]MBU1964110.1 GGDEF domain-containing protein [Patescibacteria group bacterium]